MKGILFKPWKTKAIAEGGYDREWQTRRVIKPQPSPDFTILLTEKGTKPRYQVGEVVYIKEAFTYITLAEKDPWKDRAIKDGSFRRKPDGSPVTVWYKLDGFEIGADWENPRTMPAWAARYFTTILAVRAERLHLPLSPEEFELEGGEQALPLLELIDGMWEFTYTFKLKEG